MVHMMTQYREQKRLIRVMVVVAMVGGICYLMLGITNAISALTPVLSPLAGQPGASATGAVVAAAINLVIGVACIRVSAGFRRYAKVWDARLEALARSESELKQMLEKA
jgi:hypothetical protein